MAERTTGIRRRQPKIAPSALDWRGGLPINSSNGSSDRQAVGGFPELKLNPNAAVVTNSSNIAASVQSGTYRSNAPRDVSGSDPKASRPRSDGVSLKFLGED